MATDSDLARRADDAIGEIDRRVELVTDPEILQGYRYDQAAHGLLSAGMPAALARPRTTADVQSVVRAAGRFGVPVVPRGAGSGLSGGANAVDGCVVLSLDRMTEIEEIDERSLVATVGPGVVKETLRSATVARNLWYAPDPASVAWSTIGGNVATNAGGLCCVKYGVTRDAVLGLDVVLADGRVVRLGRRTRKGVVAYDLVSLMVGSEGTLGIVTGATLRLLPPPGRAATLAASFPTLGSAGAAIARISRETVPSLLELMTRPPCVPSRSWSPWDSTSTRRPMCMRGRHRRGHERRRRRAYGRLVRGSRRDAGRDDRRGGRGTSGDGRPTPRLPRPRAAGGDAPR